MLNIVRKKGDVYIQHIHLNTFIEQQKRYDNYLSSFMTWHTKLEDAEIVELYHTIFSDKCYWAGTKVERVITQIGTNSIPFTNILTLPRFIENTIILKDDLCFLIVGFSRLYAEKLLHVEFRLIYETSVIPYVRNYKLRNF